MNLFLIRISKVVIIPIIIFVFILIYWDPFKVFFSYRDYYTNNSITCNREDICFKLLNKRDNNISNFIVGSSRSQAFKTVFWSKKINQNPKNCFHYDGSGMGIYRATKAIQYIDKKTNKIDNLLLIIDTDFFMENSNKNGQFIPEGHLYIQHPAVSGESKLSYYWTFLKASFDPQFIFFNLLNRTTGKYYDFMGNHILKSKNYNISDNYTGDIWYSYDKDIQTDSIQYYHKLLKKGVFYKRQILETSASRKINSKSYSLLKKIKKVVDKNHTNIKIVISPLYNKLFFNDLDKKMLVNLFGKTCVFDFSGNNSFTSKYTNYYESSHFKPYIANKILDVVYPKSNKTDLTNKVSN